MADKIVRTFGPVALSNTLTTNIYNNTSSLIKDTIRQIHFVNKTSSPATVSLWLGATNANAAGTEILSAYSIAANSTYDFFCTLEMLSTDFLVGGASASATITATGMGSQQVA